MAAFAPRAVGVWALLFIALAAEHPAQALAGARRQLRRKKGARGLPPSNGAEAYFLLQYGNQFCGGDIAACQQVYPDGICHMSGSHYVRMSENPDGTMKVEPGADDSCNCGNAEALTYNYVVDGMNTHGRFTAPENSGCLSGGGIGVRLIKGFWCEESTFQSCQPRDAEFTSLVKDGCIGSYDADVASAANCNYPGFHLKSTTILKHVAKKEGEEEEPKLTRQPSRGASFRGGPGLCSAAGLIGLVLLVRSSLAI